MSNNVEYIITNKQYYKDIADAIREKNGTSEKIKPNQMAEKIYEIEQSAGNFQSPLLSLSLNSENSIVFRPERAEQNYLVLSSLKSLVTLNFKGTGNKIEHDNNNENTIILLQGASSEE